MCLFSETRCISRILFGHARRFFLSLQPHYFTTSLRARFRKFPFLPSGQPSVRCNGQCPFDGLPLCGSRSRFGAQEAVAVFGNVPLAGRRYTRMGIEAPIRARVQTRRNGWSNASGEKKHAFLSGPSDVAKRASIGIFWVNLLPVVLLPGKREPGGLLQEQSRCYSR